MPTTSSRPLRRAAGERPLGQRYRADRGADGAVGQLAGEEAHRRRADEAGDEEVGGPVVQLLRRGDLLQQPAAQDGDPIAEGHRLRLIVGDVDGRRAELVLQARDLRPHLHAQLRVEVGERLVHQEGLRLAHDRAPHRHALALAAGEVGRLALELLDEVEHLRRSAHLAGDLVLRPLRQLQREAHVLGDRHVRVERVGLEDHRDVALLRRAVGDDGAVDQHVAVGDLLQAREHPQRGRLAAAGGADEDHELAVADRQVEVADGLRAVGISLRHAGQFDRGHRGDSFGGWVRQGRSGGKAVSG